MLKPFIPEFNDYCNIIYFITSILLIFKPLTKFTQLYYFYFQKSKKVLYFLLFCKTWELLTISWKQYKEENFSSQ